MLNKDLLRNFNITVKSTNRIINCHKVYGVNILPGVCFIDVLYRALKQMGYRADEIELRSILFKKPVSTAEGINRKVTFWLSQRNDTVFVNARSCAITDDGITTGETEEIFSCEIHETSTDVTHKSAIDIDLLKRQAEDTIKMEKVFQYVRQLNICHYDFMKSLGNVYEGKDYLLASLRLGEEAKSYVNDFYTHPVLLDSSTLVPFFYLSKSGSNRNPYIPIYLESFYALRKFEDACYVYMQKPAPADAFADVISTDYMFYDMHGQLIAVMKRLTGKQIHRESDIKRLDSKMSGDLPTDEPASKKVKMQSSESADKTLKSKVFGIISYYAGKAPGELDENANFYDIGLDSVKLLKIADDLEKELCTKLYPTLLFEYQTAGSLIEFLQNESRENNQAAESSEAAIKTVDGDRHIREQGGESVKAFIKRIIAAKIAKGEAELDQNQNFYDMGLDSVMLIELEKTIEKKMNVSYYPTILFEYNTIRKLTDYLNESDHKTEIQDKTAPKTSENKVVLFEPVWSASDIKTDCLHFKNIMIFAENDELLKVISSRETTGHNFVLVTPGHDFAASGNIKYEINPDVPENYERLFNEIEKQDMIPDAVVFVLNNGSVFCCSGAEAVMNRNINVLTFFCGAFLRSKHKKPINLLYTYPDCNNIPSLLCRAADGFARTAVLENSRISVKTAAYPAAYCENKQKIADIILNELCCAGDDIEVKYNDDGSRFVKSFFETADDLNTTENLPVKQGGIYLITGGLGGIGTAAAKSIFAKKNCTLLMTGRSRLNAQKRRLIDDISLRGIKVKYIRADVSVRSEVKKLYVRIKNEFKNLNGIIHCAGVNKDSLIIKKAPDEINAVIAPKLSGTLLLDEFFCDEKLDFFILTSSLSAVTGNAGQSDYAYANSFLDAFSEYRNTLVNDGKRFGKTVSVNYPLWKDGGMSVDKFTLESLKELGFDTLETEDGIKILKYAFWRNDGRVCAVAGDTQKIKAAVNIKPYEAKIKLKAEINLKTDKIKVLGNYTSIKQISDIDGFWRQVVKGSPVAEKKADGTYHRILENDHSKTLHLMVKTYYGLELETFVCGSGTPVLFLPPFGMTVRIWSYQIMEFSKNHRVIAVNSPGHGLSTTKDKITLDEVSKAIIGVLEALNINERVCFIGASYGGMIVQKISVNNPDITASIVLSGSFSRFSPEFSSLDWQDALKIFAGLADKDLTRIKGEIDEDRFSWVLAFIHKSMSNVVNVQSESFGRLIREDTWENIGSIKAPVLLVTGKKDQFKKRLCLPDEDRQMLLKIKHASHFELDGAGHFPYLTHWELFNNKVAQFWDSQSYSNVEGVQK